MNRFEILEKMFKKFNVTINGKEIFEIIENDICANGKDDGNYQVEVGKFGEDRDLFFVEVAVKTKYDEEDDVYTTDIDILSVSCDSKGVIYPSDIEVKK